MSSASRTYQPADNRGTREIERDIEQTRSEMDRTLDEIGDRLHPRHLLDDVMDLFRSEDGERSAWISEARRSSRKTLLKIRRNPIPALLVGAGIAYLLMDDDESEARQQGQRLGHWNENEDPMTESGPQAADKIHRASAGQSDPWRDADRELWTGAAAWQDDYEWSDAAYDQQVWNTRAESALSELQTTLSQGDLPAHKRIRSAASKVLELSGRNRNEIRRALRAQWDETPEHSGSFVDARTGQPYDDSYGMESRQSGSGQDWRHLAGVDVLSSDSEDQDQTDWREHADSTLQSIQSALSDAASTAKQKLAAVSKQLGALGSQSRHFADRYGSKTGQGVRQLGQGARRSVSAAGHQLSEGAAAARRQVGGGYHAGRDLVAETVADHPLAAGAAVLGLGLILGSLLPRTQCEDEAFGAQADQAKRDAKQLGKEAAQRGQQVAGSVGEAAKQELQRQGLSPGQLAEKAKQTVSAVGDTLAQHSPSKGNVQERVQQVAATVGKKATEEVRHQGAALKDSARRDQT